MSKEKLKVNNTPHTCIRDATRLWNKAQVLLKQATSLLVKLIGVNNWADFILGKVLVLPNVLIVSYEIAKCIKEITRGSIMGRYFND